ncbi:MAG: hypothetical protein ACR2PF_18945 [Rhizobiaceae bacterium]
MEIGLATIQFLRMTLATGAASQTNPIDPTKPEWPRVFIHNAQNDDIREFALRSDDFDLAYESSALTDFDVIIIFVEGWNSGTCIDEMDSIEKDLKGLSADICSVRKEATMRNSRQFCLYFYNTKGWDIDMKSHVKNDHGLCLRAGNERPQKLF